MASENQTSPASSTKKKKILLLVAAIIVGVGIKMIFFSHPFRYSGTLEATKVDLSSRLASTLADVKVQEGEHVTVGQELLTFLCDDVKVAYDLATANYERSERLFRAGTVSPETMDQIKNRKSDADVRMSWCHLQSPIAGTVLDRYHEPGEWVAPGTKLITLADIKNVWAYIYVPQPSVALLKTGQKLPATLPELGDRVFEGTILKINSEAEFTPKNVQTEAERSRLVFGVKIGFQGVNDDETLKPGMTVEVELPKK
jgi:HlyD family secretion protein